MRQTGEGALNFVATDKSVQDALIRQLEETVTAFAAIEDAWEDFDIAEDYGAERKIKDKRSDEKWDELSRAYEANSLPQLSNPTTKLPTFDWYFAEFFDNSGRKLVGIKRAVHFRVDIGAQHRLVRWLDDSLTTVSGSVMRLDKTFDALVTNEHVFFLNPRQAEYVAGLSQLIGTTAVSKVGEVELELTFLDLSRLKKDIDKHARKARVAIAIASRGDLDKVDKALLLQAAEQQGVKFKSLKDGRLQVLRRDEFKLLEILDHRRYATKIHVGDAQLFRATARQRVQP